MGTKETQIIFLLFQLLIKWLLSLDPEQQAKKIAALDKAVDSVLEA